MASARGLSTVQYVVHRIFWNLLLSLTLRALHHTSFCCPVPEYTPFHTFVKAQYLVSWCTATRTSHQQTMHELMNIIQPISLNEEGSYI